ncbi:MAG TPA: hypothetical protein VK987_09770 [Anaerolineae bacterium]|nr:hypothetical protein [Anaerolineae bacterium]
MTDEPTPNLGPTHDETATLEGRAPGEAHNSDAILPFGERLDEIAQERFNRTDWIELAAAIILALATIVAAWSAYQATRWGGEQAKATRNALAAKADATQQTNIAATVVQIDVQLWTLWLQQHADENQAGADFVQIRFRDEFRPAFEAWLAQVPAGEAPPSTPFTMETYAPAAGAEAERLNAQADEFAHQSAEANQTGDNFVLVAVVMASVLFFAGVGTKLKGRGVRLFMLLFAALFFVGGVTFMLSMPQNVGI